MKDSQFIIRLSCNDLAETKAYFNDQGFSTLIVEEDFHAVWLTKNDFQLCLVEGAADSPALVSYCHKPDDTIRGLEKLGIIFHFSADSYGNHFEANFTDPAGFPIIVADVADLPKGILLGSSPLQELSLPSVNLLSDSINFWLSLDFEVKPCGAQPHPWVVLTNGNMTIGIHQDQRWSVAGLCFDQHKCLFTGERIELDIKVYEKLSIGQTQDGCRIYTLG
jgi:hypothetical protein